jgi:hypothetical protein
MDITLEQILTEFSKDLLNAILYQMALPYKASNGKTYKGLEGTDLYKSMNVEFDGNLGLNVLGNDYFVNVDQGRRAGADRPPTEAILKWIRKKGIRARNSKGQFASMTQLQLSYLIRNSIKTKGIRRRNIIKDSISSIEKLYKDNVETGIQRILDELLKTLELQFNNNVGNGLYLNKGKDLIFTIKGKNKVKQ